MNCSACQDKIEDEDDIWEFLKRKRLCASKTLFVLQSKYISFENDDQDLPEINSCFIKTTTSFFRTNEKEEEKRVRGRKTSQHSYEEKGMSNLLSQISGE